MSLSGIKLFFLSSLCTLSLFGAEDDWALNNSFTLYGDFAYFKREQSHKHKLVIDSSTTDCNCRFPSCNAVGLVRNFDFEPGFKAGATYMTRHTVWDFFYLWINPWEGHCLRSAPRSLIFSVKNPGITADFNKADEGSAHYTSQFQNCELNFFRYVTVRHGDYFSSAWMVGLRYMNLRESLDISFIKEGRKSSYKVHTMNHIPTPQIGGLIAWNPTSKLSWDLLFKVGVGFDAGEQKTFLGDLNNTVVVRDDEKSGFSTPFLAEAGITLSYQPLSYLNLHAAYQVIYLSGVALAPDQLVKSSHHTPRYRANGAPLIHGLTAGLGWSF
jgi:hypothetical protein